MLEIQPKIIEYNENLAREDRIVKIVSKIEHSIFDKNFTYFANPNKETLLENSENQEKETEIDHNNNNNKKESHNNNNNGQENHEDHEKAKGGTDQDSLEECLVSENSRFLLKISKDSMNSFDEENETYKEMIYLEDDKKEGPFFFSKILFYCYF